MGRLSSLVCVWQQGVHSLNRYFLCQMLFQALGLHSEQDRRSIFTLFLNSEFLGNAVELQDPDPDWAANCRLLQQQF